jgi:hypothetical protein
MVRTITTAPTAMPALAPTARPPFEPVLTDTPFESAVAVGVVVATNELGRKTVAPILVDTALEFAGVFVVIDAGNILPGVGCWRGSRSAGRTIISGPLEDGWGCGVSGIVIKI